MHPERAQYFASSPGARHPAAAGRPVAPASFQLSDLIAVVIARKKLVLQVAGGFVLFAFVALLFMPVRYTSSAEVVVDQRKDNPSSERAQVFQATPSDPATLQNQIQMVQSRDVAARVITELKLYDDPEFNAPPSVGSILLSVLNPRNWFTPPGSVADANARKRDAIIDNFAEGLSVSSLGLSTTMTVSYSAKNPVKASKIANATADAYVQSQIDAKRDTARQTIAYLSERIAALNTTVQADEAAVQRFKAENRINDIEVAAGSNIPGSLVDQQMAALSAQIVIARADLSAKQAQLARVGGTDDVSQVTASPLIMDLRKQQADLQKNLADMAVKYGARHPKMIAAESAQRDLEQKIQLESARIGGAMANDVASARAQLGSLQGSLRQTERMAQDQNLLRVQLKALQSKATASRNLYDSFVTRLRETQGLDIVQLSDAKVISRAPIPLSASGPRRSLLLVAAIPVGLLLGVLVALLAERFSPETMRGAPGFTPLLRRREKPKQAPQFKPPPVPMPVPVLANLRGASAPHSSEMLFNQPHSAFAQEVNGLLHRIAPPHPSGMAQVVSVTSAQGEGSTAVAVALARAASLRGLRTIVVDGNLTQGMVATAMGLNPLAAGMTDVLAHKSPLSQTLVRDPRSSALVLSSGRPTYDTASFLASSEMAGLMRQLRQHCDLVVMDAAPVLKAPDMRALAPLSDAVLMVAADTAEPSAAVHRAANALVGLNAGPVGVVLTR